MRNLIVTQDHIVSLRRLQEIETDTARVEKKLDGVGAKTSVQGKRLKKLEVELERVRGAQAEEKTRYGVLEEEIAELTSRVAKSEEYLRVVTNNKDYQILRREVDDNTKRISELESLLLALMEDLEGRDKQMAEITEAHDAEAEKVKSIEQEIYNDTVEERESILSMARESQEIAAALPPGLLDHYEKLLKTTGRLAVVDLFKSTCYGCFMNIPPQLAIEIHQNGGLHYCPRCHRILFSKEEA